MEFFACIVCDALQVDIQENYLNMPGNKNVRTGHYAKCRTCLEQACDELMASGTTRKCSDCKEALPITSFNRYLQSPSLALYSYRNCRAIKQKRRCAKSAPAPKITPVRASAVSYTHLTLTTKRIV